MAYYDRSSTADRMARGLGWFSIGIGLTEMLAGRSLARWMGMEDKTTLIRAYGAREVVAGIGLLSLGDPKPWIWGRIAGDGLDLATLAAGLTNDNPRRGNVLIALGAVTAASAMDAVCARALYEEEAAAWTPPRDYGDRSGLPKPAEQMRGAARDAPIGADMRTPEILKFRG